MEPTDTLGDETTTGADDDLDAPSLDLPALAAELTEVEVALTRLDDGSYGRCDACGRPIDDDVLATRPAAVVCSAHLL